MARVSRSDVRFWFHRQTCPSYPALALYVLLMGFMIEHSSINAFVPQSATIHCNNNKKSIVRYDFARTRFLPTTNSRRNLSRNDNISQSENSNTNTTTSEINNMMTDEQSLGSATNNINRKEDKDGQNQQPTAQELILQEALGLDPESETDKKSRQEARKQEISTRQSAQIQNVVVAISAFLLAVLNYGWQYTHPITSTSLLVDMQRNSPAINVIGSNGKPTIIDFWAPWCENCKKAAPTLYSIEEEYKSRVNFVMVNGDLDENWSLIERLGVDAIPHLCMVSSDGTVETALIGPIPKTVLRADLDVLLENARLLEEFEKSHGDDTAESVSTNEIQIRAGIIEQDGKKVELPYSVVNPINTPNLDNLSVQDKPQKMKLPYQMYDAFVKNPELRKLNF